MKLDDLAMMHLLLREHGWVPEPDEMAPWQPCWSWSHPDHQPRTGTLNWLSTYVDWDVTCLPPEGSGLATWQEQRRHDQGLPESHSVDELRRRLKELAQ